MCPSNKEHGPYMVQCHIHEILEHQAVYVFFCTTLSFYSWMKIVNDVFLDECYTFILVFSSDKCVESFTNILKFLCHEHNFLAHSPQLPAHGSFNRVAPFCALVLEVWYWLQRMGRLCSKTP